VVVETGRSSWAIVDVEEEEEILSSEIEYHMEIAEAAKSGVEHPLWPG
jgi:hypothetical protein